MSPADAAALAANSAQAAQVSAINANTSASNAAMSSTMANNYVTMATQMLQQYNDAKPILLHMGKLLGAITYTGAMNMSDMKIWLDTNCSGETNQFVLSGMQMIFFSQDGDREIFRVAFYEDIPDGENSKTG